MKTLAQVVAEHIEAAMVETGWNVSKAAELLGMNRRTLQRHFDRVACGPKPRSRAKSWMIPADARASSIPGAASETVIHRQSSEGAQPPGISSDSEEVR